MFATDKRFVCVNKKVTKQDIEEQTKLELVHVSSQCPAHATHQHWKVA
jgi:hypothetical protein